MPAAGPSMSATRSPAAHASPSRRSAVNRIAGSTTANTSRATSSPARTQSDLAMMAPRAAVAGGTTAAVVTSPAPTSSPRAALMSGRYRPGSSGSGIGGLRLDRDLDPLRRKANVGGRHVVAFEHVALDERP